MAEGVVIGATVGAAFTDLYNVAKDAVGKMVWCKKHCKALAQDLRTHEPIFREICRNLQMPAREWEQCFFENFKGKLEEGRLLVESCLPLSGWHPIQRFRYSRAILKLRQQILQHLQNLPALSTLQLQQLNTSLQDVREQQDKSHEELMGTLMRGNTTLLGWARQGQTNTEPGKELDELQVDRFLVGLDNEIRNVKSLLLSSGEEKMVTIVGGMGGIGKTTLALALCKDPQVRGFFEDRIHFFTVSQSPDMKGLLSTIWQRLVVETPVPLFQNEEDAYRQLKNKLFSMPSKRCLLVLDDVWSKANLENLSFEVKGFKTLITSRQAPTLETRHSHTYTLGLLSDENAQSLFCYWTFDGQDSIPPWVEEPLVVKEVILECKRLPLALKVIGASLSSVVRFPAAWRNARDKLQQAMPLGDYHEDALQRRLQTSIDALDPILRECFLDLGAYPEDSRCSANTLLDVWVYVRGMEWVDAVLALADLGSRCLVDFDKKVTSIDVGRALECGDASALVFSQHDVMRDIALCLGRKNHPPSQRTRLLMPQKGNNIPKEWQTEAPLTAQIISISTGAMMEQDWPPTLALSSAEALLLYFDGDIYHLPPFVQSMCKLKVISIRSSKPLESIVGCLGGLSQLQSIDMENVALTTPDTRHKLKKLRLNRVLAAADVLSSLAVQTTESFTDQGLQLICLEALSLDCCSRLRHLPENVGKLNCLKSLSLNSCSGLEDLPESFGELSCLEEISMKHCSKLKHLPVNFGQLRRLKHLDLMWATELEDLPESFGDLSCLEEINMDSCGRLKHLPVSFGKLRHLKLLDLTFAEKLEGLPESFGELSCLEEITMQHCVRLKHLPVSFGQLRRLKLLDLTVAFELEGLPESFGELSCLEEIRMPGCRRLKHLPESFGQLRHLKLLDLSKAIELEGLPESFGELSCLENIRMVDCRKLKHLPESFGKLCCLKVLGLGFCMKLKHLPESFGELSCLEEIDIGFCRSLTHLPESFGKLRRLKVLDLRWATELEGLPESVGELSCLEEISMQECRRLKHLPESFGQLNALKRWRMDGGVGLESLPGSIAGGVGLVALESVWCSSESLVPHLWKAVRGDIAPHLQLI